VFREWPEHVPKEVEICAVQLAGRENRHREILSAEVGPMVDELMETLVNHLEIPFAFFGHSLGALVAFVCARQVRKQRDRLPIHLFVSGRSAPQCPNRKEPFHALPLEAFIQKLRELGGTEDSILGDTELLEYLIPILRADFKMNETYQYTSERPLDCPISAFRGSQDPLMTYDDVAAWRDQTTRAFRLRAMPGGHFFIKSAGALFWQLLEYDLRQILAALERS